MTDEVKIEVGESSHVILRICGSNGSVRGSRYTMMDADEALNLACVLIRAAQRSKEVKEQLYVTR
jgi:hypothetical protein